MLKKSEGAGGGGGGGGKALYLRSECEIKFLDFFLCVPNLEVSFVPLH